MNKLIGKRVAAKLLDDHYHVCDFINIEAAVLSLYSDGKRNWIYLWCDTDNVDTDRWLLFPATRKELVRYLNQSVSLLEVIRSTPTHLILDRVQLAAPVTTLEEGTTNVRRFLTNIYDLRSIDDYLPTAESFFDSELTSDIELHEQLMPAVYAVPIRGIWFSSDFESLFRSYERVYAFLYATKPRFVKTIGDRLGGLLRAPWTGGFSRVHLYSQLARHLPALHSLKVHKLKFASPGEVEFEALQSVGESVENITLLFLTHQDSILQAVKIMKALLTRKRLNKADLSDKSDSEIGLLRDEIALLEFKCAEIAIYLSMELEFSSLKEHSPNTVVFSKAVTSFVKQLSRLAQFEVDDMLNLKRIPEEQFDQEATHD
jgi:hypothetical protein